MQNLVDSHRQSKRRSFGIKLFFFILVLIIIGVAFLIFLEPQKTNENKAKDKNIAFISEIYEKIKDNYWEKIEDKKLSGIFEKGIEQINDSQIELKEKNLSGLKTKLRSIFAKMTNSEKDKFSTQLADLALKSLPPQGRNKLFGKKKKQNLTNRVNNVNPDKNLYKTLGAKKESSSEDVLKATKKKKQEIKEKEKQTKTKEKKKEIQKQKKEVEYAKEVLTNEEKKNTYDTTGKEPTVFKRRLTQDILYIYIQKFSPTTLQELQKALSSVDTNKTTPSSLILDLRANVGGSIDLTPFILGPFIGKGNYAYKIYQQGEKEPIKTKTGWMNELVPYKKVVILANEKTQSTGEVFVSTLKKYNVGVLVGKTTHGWGTIERVFKIKNQIDKEQEHGIFLVHHITLRADNQPIQGRGIDPRIKIKSENWKNKLLKYFNEPTLVDKVEKIWNSDLPVNQ